MKNNKTWAYGAFTMNSDELGIGTIYYGAEYFEVKEGESIKIFNPNTNAVYTEDEIKAIVNGAVEADGRYITDTPENAVLGISANKSDTLFWYDTASAKAILSHTDALVLNKETGTITKAENGNIVAEAIK